LPKCVKREIKFLKEKRDEKVQMKRRKTLSEMIQNLGKGIETNHMQ